MKKWIKYIAVIGCFLLMAGIFVPDSGSKVKAEEGNQGEISDGSDVEVVSSGEEQTEEKVLDAVEEVVEQSTPWILTVKYDLGSDKATWGQRTEVTETNESPDSGARFEFTIPAETPERTGYTFLNWKCSVSSEDTDSEGLNGKEYKEGAAFSILCRAYSEITFTAQWSESAEVVDPDAAGILINSNGTYSVTSGIEYRLGTGTWTVDNGSDGCQYVGDNSFFVKESRDYTFTTGE